jgi:hypothetical protein
VATAGISSLKVWRVKGISIGSSATDFVTDATDVCSAANYIRVVTDLTD